jgi:hypothetical protein
MRVEFTLIVRNEELLNFDPKTDNFYLVGSDDHIGNWNVHKSVLLKQNENRWSTIIENENWSFKSISYKYFLAKKTSNGFFLKRVELLNREVTNSSDKLNDEWTNDSTSCGWLLDQQFELQFNFYQKPLLTATTCQATNLKFTMFRQENGIFTVNNDIFDSFVVRIVKRINKNIIILLNIKGI